LLRFVTNLQLFAGMRYQFLLSMKCTFPLLIVVLVFARSSIGFADESLFKREKEIIYERKLCLALTLDVFQPLAKRNIIAESCLSSAADGSARKIKLTGWPIV
jgi:hypothetical protein